MSSIFVGAGLGLFEGSLSQANGYGSSGTSRIGWGADGALVNAATGNLVLQGRDEFLAGVGLDDVLARTYNSLGQVDGDNNDGWRMSVYRQLSWTGAPPTDHSAVTRTTGDGHASVFTWSAGDGAWLSDEGEGARDRLTYDAGSSTWTYTEGGSNAAETYDATGRLQSARDLVGNTLTYAYTASQVTITDQKGQVATLEYSGGNLVDVKLHELKTGTNGTAPSNFQDNIRVRYGYDAQNRLTSVTVELTDNHGVGAFDTNVYTTTYAYEGTSTRVSQVSQSDGTSLRIQYVQVGSDYRVWTLSDAQGRTTEFRYDTAALRTVVTDPTGAATGYTYDALGRLVRVDLPPVIVAGVVTGSNIQYTYDGGGNISQVTDAAGRVVRYSYDGHDNLLQIQDSLGNTVTRTYDAADRMVTQTVYTGADPDGAGVQTAPGPQTTHFVYDDAGLGLLRFVVDAQGGVSEYLYDAMGEQTSSLRYGGGRYTGSTFTGTALTTWRSSGVATGGPDSKKAMRVDTAYDLTGQVKTVTRWTNLNSSFGGTNDGTQSVARYVYDANGRLLMTVAPRAAATALNTATPYTTLYNNATAYVSSFTYDGLDRNRIAQDSLGNSTMTEYTSSSHQVKVTGPSGNFVTSVYNASGDLISVAQSGSASEALGTIYYWYDADGRVIARSEPTLLARTDVTIPRTFCVYDGRGRKVAEVSPEGELKEWVYDGAGQKIQTIEYSGRVTNSSLLDASGNPLSFDVIQLRGGVRPNMAPRIDLDTADGYVGGAGYRAAYTTAGANQSVLPLTLDIADFDANATLTKATVHVVGALDGILELLTVAVGSSGLAANYDMFTNTLSLTGAGTLATYEQVLSTLKYQNLNLLGMQAGDRRLEVTLFDGASVTSNVATLVVTVAPGATLTAWAGPVVSTPATASVVTAASGAATNNRSHLYSYDAAGRLVAEAVNQSAGVYYGTGYTYDGAGRQIGATRYANAATVNVAGFTGVAGDISFTANGSLDRAERYFFDDAGQQVATLDADGYLTETVYDAAERVLQRIAYAKVTSAGATLADLKVGLADATRDLVNWTQYDGQGRVAFTVDAQRFLTVYGYDKAGNLTQQTRYTNTVTYTGTQTQASLITAATVAGKDQVTAHQYDNRDRVLWDQDAQGTYTVYEYDVRGNLTSKTVGFDPVNGVVQTEAGGASALRRTRIFYDQLNRVTNVLSPRVTDQYDQHAGNPTQQVQDLLLSARSVYDTAGRLTKSIDADGNATLFYYDNDGRLRYRVQDAGSTTYGSASGEVTEYRYDAFGDVTTVIEYATRVSTTGMVGGLLTAGTSAGAVSAFAAVVGNSADRLVGTTYGDNRGLATQVTDALTYVTNSTYDAFGALATQIVDVGSAPGAATRTDTWSYNKRGLVTGVVQDSGGIGRSQGIGYDAFGRVTSTTDANGNLTATRYDNFGRTVVVTDPLLKGITTTYDAFGRTISVTDRTGNTTTYDYNDGTRTLTTTTAEGLTLTVASNRHGQKVKVTDRVGTITAYDYDLNGNLKTATVDPSGLALLTGSSYSVGGLLQSTTDANLVTTTYSYDGARRVLLRTVDGAGLNLKTQYGYNATGDAIKVTDANNVVTETVFDRRGQALAVIVDTGGFGGDAPLKLATQYVYDALRNTVTVTEGQVASGSSNNWTYSTPVGTVARVTQYSFDKLGRRVAETVDPSGLKLTTKYVYDGNGNVVGKYDARTTYDAALTPSNNTYYWRTVYDADNRARFSIDPLGAVTETRYDAEGQVQRVLQYATPLTTTALNLITPTTTAATMAAPAPSATDRLKQNVYDKDGRLAYAVDALGGVTGLAYDGAGRVTATTRYSTSMTPANLATLTAAAAPTKVFVDTNNLIVANTSLDQVSQTVYDAAGRGVYTVDALGGVVKNVYDGNGNLVATTQYDKRLSGTITYTPDWIGSHVVLTPGVDRTTLHVFDRANRERFVVTPRGYVTETQYDALGRVKQTTQYANPVLLPPLPQVDDVNGALLVVRNAQVDQTTINTYDGAGRLKQVLDAEGKTQLYTYDGLGNKKTYTNQNGATWTYVYDAAGRLTDEISQPVSLSTLAPGSVTTADGITNAYASVVSPDGRQVYVTGKGSNSLAVYNRRADGTLVLAQVLRKNQGGVLGLGGATNLAISADGKSVYVIGGTDNTITLFSRADSGPNLGQLTWQQTLTQGVAGVDGLQGASGLYVLDDSVFVTAAGENSLAVFTRNTGNGTLTATPARIFKKGDVVNGITLRLGGAASVVAARVSSTDTGIFVASQVDGTVISLLRSGSTYVVTGQADSVTLPTLAGARALAISPDHLQLFIAGTTGFTKYALGGGGTGLFVPLYTAVSGGAIVGMQSPTAIAVSADGGTVYVASSTANIAVFHNEVGTINFEASVTAPGALSGASGLSIASDGWLYAQGTTDSSLVTFARTSPNTLAAVQVLHQGDTAVAAAGLSNRVLDTHLVYDNADNLLYRIENYNTPSESRVTGYGYDAAGRQTQTRNADVYGAYGVNVGVYNGAADAGYISQPTTLQSLNSTVTFDAFGDAVKQLDAGGNNNYKVYDQLGRVIFEIDPVGYVTGYGYDAFGNQTGVTRYAAAVSGHTLGQVYTALELLGDATHTAKLVTGPLDRTITTQYDRLNQRKVVTLPVIYAYDSASGTATSAVGPTTQFDYNAFGEQTLQQRLRTVVGATSTWDTTYDYYDLDGNRVAEIDPEGYLTQWQYSATGKVTDTKEWAGRATGVTTSGYTAPSATAATSTGLNPTTTNITFTGTGYVAPSFALNNGVTTVRESINNATTKVVELNGATNPPYTGNDAVRTDVRFNFNVDATLVFTGGYRYVGVGNWNGAFGSQDSSTFGLYLGIAGNNQLTVLGLDGVTRFDATPPIQALTPGTNYTLEIQLDAHGATLYLYTQGAARGTGYTYRLDTKTPPSGRAQVTANQFAGTGTPTATGSVLTLTSVTESNGNESSLSVSDMAGRTYSNVRETRVTYDRLDRETSQTRVGTITTSVAADGHVQAVVGDVVESQTTYDGVGNVLTTTDAMGAKTQHFYNALGNEVATVSAAHPILSQFYGAVFSNLVTYAYDAFGNQVSQTTWANGTLRTAPQASLTDLPTPQTPSNAYDATSYNFYDILGRITRSIDGQGARTDTLYDLYGHKAKVQQDFNSGTGHKVQIYEYDDRGLQLSEDDLIGSGLVKHLTGYNAFGEVTSKGLSGAAQSGLNGSALEVYAYDNAGNMTYGTPGGVGTVYVSDLEGHTTQTFVSPLTLNSTLPSAVHDQYNAQGLNSNLRLTESIYDRNGRVISQKTPAFKTAPVTIPLSLSLATSGSDTTLTVAVDRALPVASSVTFAIAPAGSSTWTTLPPTTVFGNVYTVSPRAAGLYQYRYTVNVPNPYGYANQQPIYVASGSLILQGAGLTNAVAANAVTMSIGNVGGTQSYIFTPIAGVSLAGMTAVEIGESGVRYGVRVNGGIYSIPVPSATQYSTGTRFRPIGTTFNQFFTYTNNGSGTPLATNTHWQAVDVLTQLFGGKLAPIDITSLGSTWTISSIQYLAPKLGATWQTFNVTYPGGVMTFPGGSPDFFDGGYQFKVTLAGATNSNLPGIVSPQGGPLGDTNGVISGVTQLSNKTGFDIDDAYRSSLLTLITPTTTDQLDRWGNVLSRTDPNGLVNQYRYDDFNRTIENTAPSTIAGFDRSQFALVAVKSEVAYDAVGRTIATADPNGNVIISTYDAIGELTSQTTAGGNKTTYFYNGMGLLSAKTNALGAGWSTFYLYNLVGQLVVEKDPAKRASNRYTYDELGNRTSDSTTGAYYTYDAWGHVLSQVLPRDLDSAGVAHQQFTAYAYDALGNKNLQIDSNGNGQAWTYDYFGRLQAQLGLGSGSAPAPLTAYVYDNAGEVISDTVTGATSGPYANKVDQRAYTYNEAGQKQSITVASGTTTALTETGKAQYIYDAGGRLVHQVFFASLLNYGGGCTSSTVQDTVSQYDLAGRLWNVYDSKGQVAYSYDAAGNRKIILAASSALNHIYQYDYNADNRVINQVESDFSATSFTNLKASTFMYDADGNRAQQMDFTLPTQAVPTQPGTLPFDPLGLPLLVGGTLSTYAYDFDDRLIFTTQGTTQNIRTYNLDNDQLLTLETKVSGTQTNLSVNTYNLDGTQATSRPKTDPSTLNTFTYDNAGNLVKLVAGTSSPTTYTYTYQGGTHGNYLQTQIVASNSNGSNTTHQTYDIRDGLTDTTANGPIVTNLDGLIVVESSVLFPKGLYIYQGTQLLGHFQKSDSGTTTADFGYNFTPISDSYPTVSPSNYVVSDGDSLQGIAAAVYGDSSLWYVIADANGYEADPGTAGQIGSTLQSGQVLNLPNKVINASNTANTFKPYSVSQIIGDQNPPAPVPPPAHHHCNIIATIIIAVVVVVATIFTAGAAAVALGAASASGGLFAAGAGVLAGSAGFGAAALGAAAIGGAIGTFAGQVAGNVLGVQKGFDFGAIAVGALGAVATAGIGAAANATASSVLANPFVRSALEGASSQGIGVALHQQSHFSWSQVIAGTLTGAATQYLNGVDSLKPYLNTEASAFSFTKVAVQTLENTAAGVARQAITIALGGHGKIDVANIAADAFGNALGNSIVSFEQASTKVAALVGSAQAVYRDAISQGLSFEDAYQAGVDEQNRYVDRTIERIHHYEAALQKRVGITNAVYNDDGSDNFVLTGTDATHTGIADTSGLEYVRNGLLSQSDENLIVGFSQLPDEIRITDGYTSGVRNVVGTIAGLGTPTEAQQIVRLYEESVHALNGLSVAENINFYLDQIDGDPANLAKVGLAIHGLLDSVYHAQYSGNNERSLLVAKTYNAPIGHGFHGSEPDYVTPFKVAEATDLANKAFADVSGADSVQFRTADVRARTQTYSTYLAALALTGGKTGKVLDDAYKTVYDRGNRFQAGVHKLPDPIFGNDKIPFGRGSIFGSPVTLDSSVQETADFLQTARPLRGQDPNVFLARGLDAARQLANAFNEQFGRGYARVTNTNYGQDSGSSYRTLLAHQHPPKLSET